MNIYYYITLLGLLEQSTPSYAVKLTPTLCSPDQELLFSSLCQSPSVHMIKSPSQPPSPFFFSFFLVDIAAFLNSCIAALLLHIYKGLLAPLPAAPLPSLVVHILSADNLVDDPVENVEDEEGHGEANAGDLVDLLGPLDEEFPHLLGGARRRRHRVGRVVVVGSLDRDAILGLQAGWPHPIGSEVEPAFTSFVLLEQIEHGTLLKMRYRQCTLTIRLSAGGVLFCMGKVLPSHPAPASAPLGKPPALGRPAL